MSDYTVEAELREKTGRSESRRLRRAGKLPGVIYGGDKPELPIVMDALTLSKLLDQEHFHTAIIAINVKGARGKNEALLKDVQYDPLKDTATHIDFYRVSSESIVDIEVPVHAINYQKCPGLVAGGSLEIIRHSLSVHCRADSIPDHIDIDCSGLKIGDSIHINDIALPKGVEVPHGEDFAVVHIAAPRVEVEAAPAAEAEAAPAAAGEATPAAKTPEAGGQ
jgi:large subunit ribosomal protein L25